MAYLINRNPPGRIQCLHALCKLIENKYKINVPFRMSDIKFDSDELNIHSFCDLLIENKAVGLKYCRYKENPLNASGCSLTNGVKDDTTKSKEISNTVNSLHALGFINRIGNSITLTASGADFAKTLYNSDEMLCIIRNSVLKYGLFVGVLFQISRLGKTIFDTNEINVGYPKANEKFLFKGNIVTVSSGSTDDSNTRTKSCILAWATTAGFIYPIQLLSSIDKINPHISSSEYILQNSHNLRKYKVIEIPSTLFNGTFITERPLDYKNLTKNVGSLRENNQRDIRELTMKFESKIQNRRFAILYFLNNAFMNNTNLNLTKIVNFMLLHEDFFVIERVNFYHTMCEEIKIAFISGIPFTIQNDVELHPHTGININELALNAPTSLLNILKNFKL